MENLILGLSTTVIGMVVVFLGLVVLIGCISLLNKVDSSSEKKHNEKLAKAKENEPLEQIEQVAPVAQEDVVDDQEVIAAITAAIACMWQEESGFVVRRVRRINQSPAWQRSAREEQIYSRM